MSEKHLRKLAKKTFELQQDESDCGVAALASILQFYGGYVPLEKLRAISGTTVEGTTMLGLLQGGEQCGLKTEAFEGTIKDLKEINVPTLLHIVKDNVMEHYVVCYGFINDHFIIGDPEDGIKAVAPDTFDQLWKSKALLTFEPNSTFVKKNKITKAKYGWIKEAIIKDKNLVISTILLGMFISGLNFSTAIFTEKLVDNLIPSQNVTTIILGLCTWLILMALRTIFSYLRQTILIRQSFVLNNRLIGYFIKKLIHLPKMFFDSRKKGDLITRLFDTEKIQSSTSVIISQDFINVLTLFSAIITVLFYSSVIGLFLVILVPIYFTITYYYYSRIYTYNKQLMSSFAKNESEYIDNLSGIETIKQQNQEATIIDQLLAGFKEYQNRIVSVSKLEVTFKTVNDSFGLLAVFFVLCFSVTSVLSGTMQTGDMLAIFSISSIALSSTSQLAFSITHLQETKAALDRTYDVISISPEDSTGLEIVAIESIIFQDISFRYPGHLELIKDSSFEIKKGNIYALHGENGSGKSTTLQMIQRFYEQEKGDILINEININEIQPKSIRKLIGIVPQEINIFNKSLTENICLDKDLNENHFMFFLKEHGFDRYFDSFPQGLHTVLGEEGIKVSGGQKQLIALARALYISPHILLLDEFTSSMDDSTEQFAINLVKKVSKKMGVFIVSHNPKIIALAEVNYELKDKVINKMK